MFSLSSFSQVFTDPRDGQDYETVRIGNISWFNENLRFESPQSFCAGKKGNEGCEHGNYYNFQDAGAACPSGWRLPTVSDWDKLVDELSKRTEINRYGFKKQYRVDFASYDLFTGKVLNLKAIGRVEGSHYGSGSYVDFWTRNAREDQRYHMHITSGSLSGHSHKHHIDDKPDKTRMFPIRCVRDLNE